MDGIADSGGSRECAESGRSSNNATNAKEEDAPGNQDVIEINQYDKEGIPLDLPNRTSEVCHIIDDNTDESSPPSVRGKSPIGQSTTSW